MLWAIRLDSTTKKPVSEPFAVRISLEQVQSDVWMMQLPDM